MSDINSLEAERQSVLARMQANREKYRRMLMENSDVHVHGDYVHTPSSSSDAHSAYGHYGHSFADYSDFRHNPAVRFVREHPLLTAAAVVAVFAIGPRRIARTLVTGGTALTAATLRNQQNVDMLGKLIASVGSYLQRDRPRSPP